MIKKQFYKYGLNILINNNLLINISLKSISINRNILELI